MNTYKKLRVAEQLINYLASALDGQNDPKYPLEVQLGAKKLALARFEEYTLVTTEKWKHVDWELASSLDADGTITIFPKTKE